MAIRVPGTAVNYPNALLGVGLNNGSLPGGQTPQNGPQCVPVELDWSTMGGANKIVGFDLGNAGGTRAFTQIAALHVDNSGSGSEVQFIFTDTQETYTVPAYCPYALFPIFTKALQFYCVSGINSEVVESTDTTRFSLFNFVPPPVVLPAGAEQNLGIVGGVSTATASTQIIPTGVNGTIEDMFISLSMAASNTGDGTWALQDGSSNLVARGTFTVSSGTKYNVILAQLTDVAIRFTNGLSLVISQTAVLGGTINVNLYYRTP